MELGTEGRFQVSRPLRAAFFAYSWRADGDLDGYIAANVDAIRSLGIDVDLYLGNHFTERRGIKGLSPQVSLARFERHLRNQNYDFAISFNNALVTPSAVDALDCRIVSVIVDSEQHLFDHDERGGYSSFDLDVAIAPIYSSLVEDVERLNPRASGRLHFLPPATQLRAPARRPRHEFNISWIASLVGDANLDGFAVHVSSSREDAAITALCLEQISRTGYLDHLRSTSDVARLAARVGWDLEYLEMQLQNIVTNNERVAAVDRLASRGLRLFGNPRWRFLITHSLGTAKSLVIGETVSSHAEQMDVYDKSLLSINIPQIQARTGIQYRVLDVMTSQALLLTKFIPNSDLALIFGADCPVPTFESHDDLVRLADHFLTHETERADLVCRCNQLVSKGFSFLDRAMDYLKLSNPDKAANLLSSGAPPGTGAASKGRLRRVSREQFTNWTGHRT